MHESLSPSPGGQAAAAAQQVFSLIGEEMSLVEAEFQRQASSNVQIVNELARYVRESGGKRVRPALLILSTHAAGGNGKADNVIRMATVMEMLHTATLVHDDIIDNADIRRNRASVNAQFGDHKAVLMGDWLYMSAFETSLKERSLQILDILTSLTRQMTEGELIQTTTVGDLDISEFQYFDILKRKTAYLFSACCEIGAILGRAREAEQQALRDYGLDLGIAFQLLDDLLDVTADSTRLGKAAGSDLLEGKVTLPMLLLLEAEPAMRPNLQQVVSDHDYLAISRSEIRRLMESHGIIAHVRDRAKAHCERARKSLDILLKTEYRLRLADVLSFVIERQS